MMTDLELRPPRPVPDLDVRALEADLRARVQGEVRFDAGTRGAYSHQTWFGYPHDNASFTTAVMRCVGVGQCRRSTPNGGVMCPSYQVTREEEHSTRGRARLLFEMLHGHANSAIRDGFRSEAVRDALDLCLACKGCKSGCPSWRPAKLDRTAIVQAHCHQHAVLGFDADRKVMARAGIDAQRLDSGCCGLAGNFGFEAGHYEVSMACAEQALLPAVRNAAPTPSCSPTGSAAAPRSTTAPAAARSTSPRPSGRSGASRHPKP
jgi:ferredoxin